MGEAGRRERGRVMEIEIVMGEGGRPSREGEVCVGDAPSGWEAGGVGESCSSSAGD